MNGSLWMTVGSIGFAIFGAPLACRKIHCFSIWQL